MDIPAPKAGQNSFSAPLVRAPYRRRRIIWATLALFGLVFFFGAPWEFPARGLGSSISRANVAKLVKQQSSWVPEEIFGLLHLVTKEDGQVLSHDPEVDPRKPMELSVYNGGQSGNWKQYVKELEENYPLVVFSKVISSCDLTSCGSDFEHVSADVLPVSRCGKENREE